MRSHSPLPTDSPVIVHTRDRQTPGIVVADTPAHRSYLVQTLPGTLRRNRQHLVPIPLEPSPPAGYETTTDTTPTGSPLCNE